MGKSGDVPAFRLTAAGAAHLLFGALPAEDLFRFGEAGWLTGGGQERKETLRFLREAFPARRCWISEWY